VSAFYPSNVLEQFAANVELVVNASPSTGAFTRSSYRFTLDKEPDSAPDGLYFLDVSGVLPRYRSWGDGSKRTDGNITVRLLYSRPGGNLSGGDRQSVLRNAADDCDKLADVCENPDNYGASTSGIRTVIFNGASRVQESAKGEIWEARFTTQWQSVLDTDTVGALTQGRFILDGIASGTNQLVAFNTNSLATGSEAFVVAEWRVFRLKKTDVQVPDNTAIVAAIGGGNWLAEWYDDASAGTLTTTVA
jgi:hypothetical protein